MEFLHGDFVKDNMMGPNALVIAKELTEYLPLRKGLRVLDLGCGKGITSLYLAEKYGVTVFAVDHWVDPSENFQRFKAMKMDEFIIPVKAEAHDLPFAQGYFDAVICIDVFHYFGCEQSYLSKHLIPLVKEGGFIAMAIPGLKKEFPEGIVPEELKPYWQEDFNFHSIQWWRKRWEREDALEISQCREMMCHDKAWADWLACDNPNAKEDVAMLEAENGQHFNTVAIVANVKQAQREYAF